MSFTRKSPDFVTHRKQKSWLIITAIVIAGAAPFFFLGTMPATAGPARLLLGLLSWPLDGSVTYASADTRFLSALTGGFLLGWGVTVWLLSRWVFDDAPEGTRKTVVYGLLAWFVLDSAGSIASGNAINAFFNLLILLLAVGPLWWPVSTAE